MNNDLDGSPNQGRREGDPESLRGLEVYSQFKADRLLHREFTRLGTFEDFSHISSRSAVHIRETGTIGYKTAKTMKFGAAWHGAKFELIDNYGNLPRPTVKIYAPKEGFGIYGSSLPSSFYRKDEMLPPEMRYYNGDPPRSTPLRAWCWSSDAARDSSLSSFVPGASDTNAINVMCHVVRMPVRKDDEIKRFEVNSLRLHISCKNVGIIAGVKQFVFRRPPRGRRTPSPWSSKDHFRRRRRG